MESAGRTGTVPASLSRAMKSPATVPRPQIAPPDKTTAFPIEARRETPTPTRKHRVCFEVDAPPGSEVSVVGSFNAWEPGKHPLRPGPGEPTTFRRAMLLPSGRHEYKYVVDGEWSADHRCPHWVINEFDTLNSILILGA